MDDEYEKITMETAIIGQKIMELEGTLTDYCKKIELIPELTERIEKLKLEKEEILKEYEKKIKDVKDQCEREKEEKKKQAENLSSEITRVNEQIEYIKNQIKEKESENVELKNKIDDLISHRNTLKQKVEAYTPVIEFLKRTRNLPMYLDDLEGRMVTLQRIKENCYKEFMQKEEVVQELQSKNVELQRSIDKQREINVSLEEELEGLKEEINAENGKLNDAKEAVTSTQKKINDKKSEIEDLLRQREAELEKINSKKPEMEIKLKQQEEVKQRLKQQLDDLRNRTKAELSESNEKITLLREKLSNIKNNGCDDDIPHVDLELKSKINAIIMEKEQLIEQSKMLSQAIDDIKKEIENTDIKIYKHMFRSIPPENVLSNPEFKSKMMQIEEYVIQNITLESSIKEMTQSIDELRKERIELEAKNNQKK